MGKNANLADAVSDIKAAAPARPKIDRDALQRFLEHQNDVVGPVVLGPFEYVEDAGSSNGIALFDADLGGKTIPLVLRYAPGEQLLKQKRFDHEFLTLQVLERHEVAAPRARWCDPTDQAIGFPFLIMERLQGRAPANSAMYSRGLLSEVSADQRRSILLQAAGFHGRLRRAAIGPEAVPHLAERGIGATSIERELSWWLDEAKLVTHPTDPRLGYLVDLVSWMVDHQPDVRPGTLSHGDGQIANLMFRDGQLVAGLDWELSYLGHNEADLALVVMLVAANVPAGEIIDGLPSEADLIRRYEEEAQAPVEHWEFFRLFNLVKVSTIMLMSGRHMDAEMADSLWQLNAADREAAWGAARIAAAAHGRRGAAR